MRHGMRGVCVMILAASGAACSNGGDPDLPPDGLWSYSFAVEHGDTVCVFEDAFFTVEGDVDAFSGLADGFLNCDVPGTSLEGGQFAWFEFREGMIADGAVNLHGNLSFLLQMTHTGRYTGDRMSGPVSIEIFENDPHPVIQGIWQAERDVESEELLALFQGSWIATSFRYGDEDDQIAAGGHYELRFDGRDVRRIWMGSDFHFESILRVAIQHGTLWMGAPRWDTEEVFAVTVRDDDHVTLENANNRTFWRGAIELERAP